MFLDFAVSEDCINPYTYGEICLGCGCCSRNKDNRDRVIKTIRYYRERLNEELSFCDWSDKDKWGKIQRKIRDSNVKYYKRKIRIYKKILRTMN